MQSSPGKLVLASLSFYLLSSYVHIVRASEEPRGPADPSSTPRARRRKLYRSPLRCYCCLPYSYRLSQSRVGPLHRHRLGSSPLVPSDHSDRQTITMVQLKEVPDEHFGSTLSRVLRRTMVDFTDTGEFPNGSILVARGALAFAYLAPSSFYYC